MRKVSGVLISIFFLALSGYSQAPFFQQYFLLKKNEPVQINTIFQDKSGFVWFGTNKGLFKFDGKAYQRYTKTDSLPDETITAIAQDSVGRIWTGHKNGKLSFFENARFHTFEPSEGSSSQPISDILFDKMGSLWFSTLNDGLYYFIKNRLYRLDEEEGMPDLFIYDLLDDQQGNIWAGTDGGLAIVSLHADSAAIQVLDYKDGLADNIVKKIVRGSDGKIWLATEDAGIIGVDPISKKFQPLMKQWAHGSITDFLIKANEVWIATPQRGLVVYDLKRGHIQVYNSQSGTGVSSIASLLKDREGNIWVGSKTGVLRTPGDHFEFIESLAPATENNVMAIAVDSHGDIWFSNHEGLFKRSRDGSGNITVRKQLINTPFQKLNIISLYVDERGSVWAGLYGDGVLRINPATGVVKHLNKELRNGNVLHITGKGNDIWLATLGGVEKISIAGEKLEIKNFNTSNGLSSDFIYQVFVDSEGRTWFATDGKGVDVLDNNGFRHIDAGLPSKVVYGFAEDSEHQLWVNVQGNGIYKLADKKFIPLNLQTGLRDNNINSFAADNAGNLLVMHDLGIDVYNIIKKRIRYFGEEAGIKNKKGTLNAVAKDFDGNILIGTNDGIVLYSASQSIIQSEPHVVINTVKVFDQDKDLSSQHVLRHDENNITIRFSGLWYQNPESLHYLYKMDNYDADWISTKDNSVTYSRLPPGDYTFRVKVSDNEDFNLAHEATLRFNVNPPFWKTMGFYFISGFLFLVSGYLYIRLREAKLKEDKLILEAKVEERTQEIQKKTEEIQAQNEEIMAQAEEIKGINDNLEMLVKQRTTELEKKNRALEEYAFINAHKLRSPLASILGLCNLIKKTNLDDEAKLINEHLQQRADELDEVVRSITKAIERGEK